MKPFILLLTVAFTVTCGCKTKHDVSNSNTAVATTVVKGATLGQVSHQFSGTGCATVVFVQQVGKPEAITLIPRDTLSKEFDVDGLEIYFDYRPLKMPNPAGCIVGIPAEIKNISKK